MGWRERAGQVPPLCGRAGAMAPFRPSPSAVHGSCVKAAAGCRPCMRQCSGLPGFPRSPGFCVDWCSIGVRDDELITLRARQRTWRVRGPRSEQLPANFHVPAGMAQGGVLGRGVAPRAPAHTGWGTRTVIPTQAHTANRIQGPIPIVAVAATASRPPSPSQLCSLFQTDVDGHGSKHMQSMLVVGIYWCTSQPIG